ncbi:MAG: hypothetical protein C0478_11095 [Planctomyces sp.]|jgi:hypothetical protein|nr:hypothetical protein [Planctomyces sp.]
MDEFSILSVNGSGGLFFHDRSPFDTHEPIYCFGVRVTGHNLSAHATVHCGCIPSHHPAPFFAELAMRWADWEGELVWSSIEGELTLRCSRDSLGHISIRTELASGPMPDDWKVEATIVVEAGQLESISRRANVFFGNPQ